MNVLGMQMPETNSHIRAVELMTEFLRLSQEKREKDYAQLAKMVNSQSMPVEISFKAAIFKLKV